MSALRLTAQSLSDPTITTIIVGPGKTKFCIRKALVCHHSDYFKGAYHAELRESQQHRFTFDDIDSKIFCVFIRWMYTNAIYLDEEAEETLRLEFCDAENEDEIRDDMHVESEYEEDSEPEEEYGESNGEPHVNPQESLDEEPEFANMTPEQLVLHGVFCQYYEHSSELGDYQLEVLLKLENEDATYDSFRPKWETLLRVMRNAELESFAVLFDLFILADRFGVKALRARVMDHLQAKRSWWWDGLGNTIPFELVTKAFDNVTEQSTVCRWLIYVFALDWELSWDDAKRTAARDTQPKQFLLRLLTLQTSGTDGDALDLCYFHEHDTWDELKACRAGPGKDLNMDAMEADYPMFDENGATTWF